MADAAKFESEGAIGRLTLTRPEQRNILGEPGDGALFQEICVRINADRSLRCVILTGQGQAFSAGGNLRAMKDRTGTFAGSGLEIRESYRRNVHPIITSLWSLEVPVVAAVNGPAVGLGHDVAGLADIRIASETARFGASFLKIGLIPGDGGAWLLPRLIGMSRAAELLYTGKLIDADTALGWGLVSQVVPAGDLMTAAEARAAEIAQQPPDVLRLTKRLLRQGQENRFADILDQSAAVQALAHQSADHSEAVDAFLEKRPPRYRGK